MQHPKRAHQVGDHRLIEQSGDAEHVRRNPARAQRGGEHAHIGECAAQQRAARRGPVGPAGEPAREPLGDLLGLVVDRLGPAHVEPPGCGEGRGREGCLGDPCVERRDDGVRRLEHHPGVAPARREVVDRCVAAREVRAEPGEVRGTRPAPSVDRLVGIADGHDRLAAEQRGEQPRLHDARVLVLVEQHGAIPRPVRLDHLVMPFADRERERDLVGELDVPSLLLGARVCVGELEERRQRVDDAEGIDERREVGSLARGVARQPLHREEVAGHRAHVTAVGDVLGQRAAE